MHESAIVTKPVGRLDRNEIDVLGRELELARRDDTDDRIRCAQAERWRRRRGPVD